MQKQVVKRRFILVATNLIGLVFYLLDVVSDCMNASLYMRYKTHYIEGAATLGFIFLPIIVEIIIASIALKIPKNYQGPGKRLLSIQWDEENPSTTKIAISYILMLTLTEPILSTYEIIKVGWDPAKRKELDDIEYKMKAERIIESIFESIPQTALQFFISGHEPYMSGLQGIAIITSLFNLSFTLVMLDMERVKQLRSAKRKMLKKKWQIYWFFKDHLWVLFGGIPLILSSMLSVSLFAPVYSKYALLFYGVIAVLFSTRWWWWSDHWKHKFYQPLPQSLITLASLCTKLLFACLIILWYVRMKMYQQPDLQKVHDPAIPNIIWPDTLPFLKEVATPAHLNHSHEIPEWADCRRDTMLRNGTFIIDFKSWWSVSEWKESVRLFLLSNKLMCLSDLADHLFCICFYCLVSWTIWDTMCFIYHMSTPQLYNPKMDLRNKDYAIQYHLSPAQEDPPDLFGEGFAVMDMTNYRKDSDALIGMVRVT